jgi:p24 family protein delta-1
MHVFRSALILLLSFHLGTALKFDLIAQPPHSKNERCIRNFVNRDTLVVVTAILDGSKGDGQIVNMHVCFDQSFWGIDSLCGLRSWKRTDVCGSSQIKDSVGNDYGRPKDITGETRMAFTSLADTAFDVCFENNLVTSSCMYFANVPLLAVRIPAYAHQTRDHLPPDTSSSTSTLAPTPKTGPASRPRRS